MGKKGSRNSSSDLGGMSFHWRTITLAAAIALVGCGTQEQDISDPSASPRPRPPVKQEAIVPLSGDCKGAVETAEKQGLIRPGSVDRNGMVILTDARWATRFDAPMQEALARCISHYIAGGQNKWMARIVFRNQVSGVVYATMEGDRFRIGE